MTIKQLLIDSCDRRGNAVALRYKQQGVWRELSYAGLLANVRQVSEILGTLKIEAGEKVALFLANCPQWPEIYFGIASVGATAVPVDAKLREKEAAHVLRDSGAKVVFASSDTYSILREIEGQLPDLRTLVLVDGRDVLPDATRRDTHLEYEAALESVSEKAESDNSYFATRGPAESDIASIIYTSGTTGRQKGAMLTHANFCSNVQAALETIEVSENDNFLLVLPLHHAFAFTTNLLVPVAAGSEISIIESLKAVGRNVREVSPTILIGVPLLTQKMYNRIWSGLKSKKLAYLLYKAGIRRPVTKGILKSLGGKLRMFVVGGAPSDPKVLRGFASLGLPIIEGYGLTETSPILTLNPQAAPKPGTVGRAVPGVELKIDSPNGEGVGEVMAKGPCIMKGYYGNEQATAEVLDGEWFHTGDLGFIDDDGYLTITGRRKNLIVNREGKNIYPEEVENEVCSSPFVLEALVLGYKPQGETGERVGVIVVPDQDALDAHGRKVGHPLSDDEMRELLTAEVKKAAAQIAQYKRPRRIQIRTEEFEKTSTAKVKRYLYAMDAMEVE